MEGYRKISVQVTEDLYQRISRNFEWGERTRVMTRLLEWLCEKIERHGREALVILLREDKFDELVTMRGGENGNA